MADRTAIDVPSPSGGWGAPWPNVAEIEAVLPHEKWTLVGGLMAQLHGIHRGIDALRPTNDVDIVLHVETTRGVASEAARALESIGYVFSPSIDDRNSIAHRFTCAESRVDLGALILKAAAYRTDSRDRERHLQDAAFCWRSSRTPMRRVGQFAGSDKSRLTLVEALHDDARAWWALPADQRSDGQAALRILTA